MFKCIRGLVFVCVCDVVQCIGGLGVWFVWICGVCGVSV